MIITDRPEGSSLQSEYNRPYIWTISFVAALGGLLFGYDWVVIGGAKPFYEKFFNLTSTGQQGWAMSCALIGCLIGALLSGGLSDKTGRKRLLLLSAFLFAVSSIGTAMAGQFSSFVFWRIVGGVAIGLASNLSPMYIAEVAPAQARGKLVAINQLTIVIGILLAQVINYLIADKVPPHATAPEILKSWNGQVGWRWMFGVTAAPSLLFFLGMRLVPESPRWLVKNGNPAQAREILAKIGGEAYAHQALAEIDATVRKEIHQVNFWDLLEPKMVKVLLLGIGLAVFQQWCGINVIFNYAEEIFSAAGYDISDTLKNIAWTGSVNMAFTFVALALVDKRGRRPLMLFGSLSLAVIYTVLGYCYQTHVTGLPMLLLVLAAIACYSMSLAPVVWVVISEIFPNRIRGAAMSIAVGSLWIACFLLTYSFPTLNKILRPAGTFWVYAGICLAGFVFIKLCLPETKGKTLEQIEKELVD
ncbi:MAG TPA: sugar porter family MFS transporter [Candidatus Saccharimonadales bacterium]|nr:sugar porter family MFS transporter [Candidatus Saccharimonadales bacterium]